MKTSIERFWRLLATAISFAIFGLSGLLISIFVVPVIYVLPGGKRQRNRRSKLLIHTLFRFYVGLLKLLKVLTYEVQGQRFLSNARLILANHPSLIDVIFLMSLLPKANCIVKSDLLRNPFTIGPVRAAGYISNDASAEIMIDVAKRILEQGDTLIIFPEGTRSVPGEPLSLKRGAANVAVRTGVDVTPVFIQCEPATLTKCQPWYKVPATRPHFVIRVGSAIRIAKYHGEDKPGVAARKLTSDLTRLFNKEMGFRE